MALGGGDSDEKATSSRWEEGLPDNSDSEQERCSSILLPSWDDVGLNEVIMAPTKLPTDSPNDWVSLFVLFRTAVVESEIRSKISTSSAEEMALAERRERTLLSLLL